MLGRKAILHTANKGKRKWQIEQEKDDGGESSFSDDGNVDLDGCENSDDESGEPPPKRKPETDRLSERKPATRKLSSDDSDSDQGKSKRFAWMDSDDEVLDGGDEEVGASPDDGNGPGQSRPVQGSGFRSGSGVGNTVIGEGGGPRPRDDASAQKVTAGDSVSGKTLPNGDCSDAKPAATTAVPVAAPINCAVTGVGSTVLVPSGSLPVVTSPYSTLTARTPLSGITSLPSLLSVGHLVPPNMTGAAVRPGMIRPMRPPAVLPPGTRLPVLSQAHLQLMGQIGSTRTLDDLWDVVDQHYEVFGAGHAAVSLYRLTMLASLPGEETRGIDPKLEKHTSFLKLCDRVDELLATPEGRASFLTADLAMAASALAKIVQSTATSGAVGRIFAELADEAESRMTADELFLDVTTDRMTRQLLTSPMLSDLAWAIAKTGNARGCFLRAVVAAACPKLAEMTCQDLANIATAFIDQTFDEADDMLRGIFDQTKQRLDYHPPPTNALFGTGLAGSVTSAAIDGSMQGSSLSTATAHLSCGSDDQGKLVWQQTGQWRFSGVQISEITSAVARHISLYDPELFHLVAQQYSQRLQDFTVPQLVKLRDTFELVRHDRDADFLAALRTSLKQREFAFRRTGYRR
eukprot:TRINITY_DN34320_c0_g1_i1.p1 TRINITY_DN34320_c0_g1~~TRINITY_DN34320_c0_g1_i1.p1  ORF type:complete len:632 (+),score=103.05 TRINITY_DN34320_c0_g1_i1:142-2037(+)